MIKLFYSFEDLEIPDDYFKHWNLQLHCNIFIILLHYEIFGDHIFNLLPRA